MTSAVILAGGLGTRLREAVPDVPKPMAPVRGRPFLEHQMDYWVGQGIDRFILSVGYRHEVISEHFGSNYRGADIEYVVENTPLGTGGGLLLAVEKLSDAFLLLNGDTFFAVDLPELTKFHKNKKSGVTFCLFATDDTDRYMGLAVDDDGRITNLRVSNVVKKTLANGGVYMINPDEIKGLGLLAGEKASLEDDIFPMMAKAGNSMFGMEASGLFIDIGIPDDFERAQEVLP